MLIYGSVVGVGITRTIFLLRLADSANGDATCKPIYQSMMCLSSASTILASSQRIELHSDLLYSAEGLLNSC